MHAKRDMIESWTEFLDAQGITAQADGHSHTATENVDSFQKITGDTICDLGHLSLLRVGGDDAGDFLQNQLTVDLRSLGADRSMLAGYCNPKGRLLCIFRITREETGWVLQLPSGLREATMERLRRYVLRAKVELSVDTRVGIGVCGKTVARGLERIAVELPVGDGGVAHSGESTITRLSGDGRPRFQIVGPVDSCVSLWEKLGRHATAVGSWTWARLDILAGTPTLSASTCETFIPQMVNLDLLGGVSFRKGCYPGQEIVARMHYLGKLKQRMARFRVDAEDRPLPGDRVYTRGNGAPTGTVVDAQPGPGSGWDLLAVVRIADLGQQVLLLKSDHGPVLFQQDLPYAFPDPEAA